jgi:hypothetical protein
MMLLVVIFLGVIALFSVRQWAQQRSAREGAVQAEIQDGGRLATILLYQIHRWANEPGFLLPASITREMVQEDLPLFGLQTFEACVLTLKPELWLQRGHEWVMTNSKANEPLAWKIVRATHTACLKEALAEKLGVEQFKSMERRLREYYKYASQKISIVFKPDGPMDEWWQDIDWWFGEYEAEAKILGVIPSYNFGSEEAERNRHVPRYRWIMAQLKDRGAQNYDTICAEAKLKFPESWQF